MSHLHPVFNVIKLTLAPIDPVAGRHAPPPPLPPELIDGKEEYVVEEILNSCMFHQKLQYLVKWEGYGVENNTWEYWDNLGNALDVVNEFHTRNPAAPCCIHALAFGSIPFRPIPPLTIASGRCNSEGGVIVRGTPKPPANHCQPPDLTANRYPSVAACSAANYSNRSATNRSATNRSATNRSTPMSPHYVMPHCHTHSQSHPPFS